MRRAQPASARLRRASDDPHERALRLRGRASPRWAGARRSWPAAASAIRRRREPRRYTTALFRPARSRRPAASRCVISHAEHVQKAQREEAGADENPLQRCRTLEAHEQDEDDRRLGRGNAELDDRGIPSEPEEGGPYTATGEHHQHQPGDDVEQCRFVLGAGSGWLSAKYRHQMLREPTLRSTRMHVLGSRAFSQFAPVRRCALSIEINDRAYDPTGWINFWPVVYPRQQPW